MPFLVLRLRRTGEDGKTETKHGKVMWPGSYSALVAAGTSNARGWMQKVSGVWTKGAQVTTELSYAEKTKDGVNREIYISDDAGFAAFLEANTDTVTVWIKEVDVGAEGRRALRGQRLQADGAEAHDAAAPYNALSADRLQHIILESVAAKLAVPTTVDVGGIKMRRTFESLQNDLGWVVVIHDNATFTMRAHGCQSVLGNFFLARICEFFPRSVPFSGMSEASI